MRNFYRFGFRLSTEYMNICPIGFLKCLAHLHQQRKVKCAKTPTDLTSLSCHQTKTTATAENTPKTLQKLLPVRMIILNFIFHFCYHCGTLSGDLFELDQASGHFLVCPLSLAVRWAVVHPLPRQSGLRTGPKILSCVA